MALNKSKINRLGRSPDRLRPPSLTIWQSRTLIISVTHIADWIPSWPRNKAFTYNLELLVRPLKCYDAEHGLYLRSFHLEVIVSSAFSPMSTDRRTASQMFLRVSR